MRYVLMAYGDAQLAALSPAEREALGEACAASDAALRASGHLVSAAGLQHSCMAATVRLQDGEPVLAGGTVAPDREPLLGIFVIEAADLNVAVRVASRMPQLRVGPIEVRPVLEDGEHRT